jgi:hypothetical protein
MRKMIFLLLMLFLGALANLTAQMRIGATSDPHVSAVLDLNKDNTGANDSAAGNNTKGLALPRVVLTTDLTNKVTPINNPVVGLMVYNTATTPATGVYVWYNNKWNALTLIG